jgi:hypothetical protein
MLPQGPTCSFSLDPKAACVTIPLPFGGPTVAARGHGDTAEGRAKAKLVPPPPAE